MTERSSFIGVFARPEPPLAPRLSKIKLALWGGLRLDDRRGDLWVSTGNGLSHFDPGTETFRNYYTQDGLLANEFYNYASAYESADGEMFFSSYAGVIAFSPQKLVAADRPYVPPVIITEMQLFGKPVPIGGKSPLKQAISFTPSLAP